MIGNSSDGKKMYKWAQDLFPINRSITGAGVRETLNYLKGLNPAMTVSAVPSGTPAFDWIVPEEWQIRGGWIEDPSGERIVDFKNDNLHVVGYSVPTDQYLSLEDLQLHLHSLKDQPTAIPYVTSYYNRNWGFCLTETQRQNLEPGVYRAVIDSDLTSGYLNYGELLLKGKSEKEVFISTYVCHPSMANNEISGPVVASAIAQWLSSIGETRYSYRFVFIPETIGSIVYLSLNLPDLKDNVIAGFNVTCVGDERCFSFLPSRKGDTLSDRAASHALRHIDKNYKKYSWLDRGSDERQYCSPGIDLPIASIMRSKFGEYPEYHTSLDDLDFVTSVGLEGSLNAFKAAILAIENNCRPVSKTLGEPQLGKRGLFPNLSKKGSTDHMRIMLHLLSYADGEKDLIEIADIIDVSITELSPLCCLLQEAGLLDLNYKLF